MKQIKSYQNETDATTTKQLNLKISSQLYEEAQNYTKSFGYTNMQELIREAIRDKLFDSKIREEYVEKILNRTDYQETIGQQKSVESLERLQQRANE